MNDEERNDIIERLITTPPTEIRYEDGNVYVGAVNRGDHHHPANLITDTDYTLGNIGVSPFRVMQNLEFRTAYETIATVQEDGTFEITENCKTKDAFFSAIYNIEHSLNSRDLTILNLIWKCHELSMNRNGANEVDSEGANDD